MDRKKKSDTADDSDLAATYGLQPGPIPYAFRVGLLLNLGRQLCRHTWAVKEAIELALSSAPIPRKYAQSVSLCPKEAAATLYEVNKARSVAKVMRKRGMT